MKFTHNLSIQGWIETTQIPSDYKEVKHLGTCSYDGDMFAAYDNDGEIHIFKGVLDEPLKTDTWYGDKYTSLLVYRTGDEGNYGIIDNEESSVFNCSTSKFWREATKEEVKEDLIKLAKKKGFENIHKLNLKLIDGTVFKKGEFSFEGNEFELITKGALLLDGVEIFNEGKWAEILEEEHLTIEERLKRLEDKLL